MQTACGGGMGTAHLRPELADDEHALGGADWTVLLGAQADDLHQLADATNRTRGAVLGDVLTFVANRNLDGSLWDPSGNRGGLDADAVASLAAEAWAHGAESP